MKCISATNADWNTCNVIIKGISMAGKSVIIFTERNLTSSDKLVLNTFWMKN